MVSRAVGSTSARITAFSGAAFSNVAPACAEKAQQKAMRARRIILTYETTLNRFEKLLDLVFLMVIPIKCKLLQPVYCMLRYLFHSRYRL